MRSTLTNILTSLQRFVVILLVVLLCSSCRDLLPPVSNNPWQVISLPTTANLLDIAFSTPEHGWIVGNRATVFETTNGGKTWQLRSFELDDDVNYRFSSVSFSGDEGWIVGQPSILLHTTDAGKSWEKVALSSKLPGAPDRILALGNNQAEMVTDVGAIYRTVDAGRNWKALVQDAVGVVRNISRSPDGKYVAVSAKGNFYSTWEPGQSVWVGHNRTSSRRVQNMGFTTDGKLWMLARGGRVL
ncbi:MAG: photosynthesis system II assembly factor Ycf48, partial [Cyanobacteria bacterium]|nr:photosynthesis system II assembly factor Ycf48 [Cyanobacteriota bacterium]MDW8203149.1 photosynthesis system II assembly factor Ycf48 [Cyanobacteriota bacterium SKYGB_h_bin112]